jgi:ABC-type Fe3+-hydroxamate transport system substrate-binding protein
MTARDRFSLLWLVALLASIVAVSGVFASARRQPSGAGASSAAPNAKWLRDATGHAAPIEHYRCIASSSSLADHLLFELAEPEQICALSSHGKQNDLERQRYGARREVSGPGDLEALLSARVDLLLVNQLGADSQLERVRASGIVVFDLGEMRGLSTLQPNIMSVAELLGDRSRGERLWQRFARRLHAVASEVPPEQRKRAIYLAVYAGKLFGATRGTSYHDVLSAAGLDDLAAQQYRDWPQYDPEQLLALDPALIVTGQGMAQALCDNPWYAELRACRAGRGGLIELPSELMGDPGLLMLDAAEALHERVYGNSAPLTHDTNQRTP